MTVEEFWTIGETFGTYLLNKDGSLDPRKGWLLKCPKGHPIRVTANFESLNGPISIGCEGCRRPYQVELKG